MIKNILLIVLILLFIIFIIKILNVKEGKKKKKKKKEAEETGSQNEINAVAAGGTTSRGDVLAWSKIKQINSNNVHSQLIAIKTDIAEEITNTEGNYDSLNNDEKIKYIDNATVILNSLKTVYGGRIMAEDLVDEDKLNEKIDEYSNPIKPGEKINLMALYYNVAMRQILNQCENSQGANSQLVTGLVGIEDNLFNSLNYYIYESLSIDGIEFNKLIDDYNKKLLKKETELKNFLNTKNQSTPGQETLDEQIEFSLEIIDTFFNDNNINIINDGMKDNYCNNNNITCGQDTEQGAICENIQNTFSKKKIKNIKKGLDRFKEKLNYWTNKLEIIKQAKDAKNERDELNADAMFDESNSRGLIASGDSNIDIGDPGPLAPGSQPPDPNIYKADVYKMFWNDTRHDLNDFLFSKNDKDLNSFSFS